MNLSFMSFLKIIIGALLGATIFWAIAFVLPKEVLGSYEQVLTLQQFGLLLGGIFGAAVTTVLLIVHDSYRPETGAAANFSMINGMGSMLIGRSESREDGSYLTTEWFCMVWLPLFPVCNYRLIEVGGRTLIPLIASSHQFLIKEKHPVRLKDIVKGYLILTAACCFVGLVAWLVENWA
jgi:hypothetical protein